MSFADLFEAEEEPVATLINIRSGKPYDVLIGRPSTWGNPYSHLLHSKAPYIVRTRAEAIAGYQQYLLSRPDLLARLGELEGKVLGCWCLPLACHGQILIRFLWRLKHGLPYSE